MTSFGQLTCCSVGEIKNLGIDFVMRRGGAGVQPDHSPESKTQGLRAIQRSGVVNVFNMDLMSRRGAAPQPDGKVAGLSSKHPHYNLPAAVKDSIDHQRHRGRSASPPSRSSSPSHNFIAALANVSLDAQRMGCRSPARAKSQHAPPAPLWKSPSWKKVGSGTPAESVKHSLVDEAPEALHRRDLSQTGARNPSWHESSCLIAQALENALQESSGQVLKRSIKEEGEELSTDEEDADPVITPLSSNHGDSSSERMSSKESSSSSLPHSMVRRSSSDGSDSWSSRKALTKDSSAITITTMTAGGLSRTASFNSFDLNASTGLTSGAEEPSTTLRRALSGTLTRQARGKSKITSCEVRRMQERVRAQQKVALRRVM